MVTRWKKFLSLARFAFLGRFGLEYRFSVTGGQHDIQWFYHSQSARVILAPTWPPAQRCTGAYYGNKRDERERKREHLWHTHPWGSPSTVTTPPRPTPRLDSTHKESGGWVCCAVTTTTPYHTHHTTQPYNNNNAEFGFRFFSLLRFASFSLLTDSIHKRR